jgi:hypothetical protein
MATPTTTSKIVATNKPRKSPACMGTPGNSARIPRSTKPGTQVSPEGGPIATCDLIASTAAPHDVHDERDDGQHDEDDDQKSQSPPPPSPRVVHPDELPPEAVSKPRRATFSGLQGGLESPAGRRWVPCTRGAGSPGNPPPPARPGLDAPRGLVARPVGGGAPPRAGGKSAARPSRCSVHDVDELPQCKVRTMCRAVPEPRARWLSGGVRSTSAPR